jgi:hypothetical protein
MRRDLTVQLLDALVAAVQEHGLPNGFSPGWLARYHGGPSPMQAGRVASFHMFYINERTQRADPPFSVVYLRPRNGDSPGSPSYSEAKFRVSPLVDELSPSELGTGASNRDSWYGAERAS